MNVTINETNNVTEISEAFSSVLVSEITPEISVVETPSSVTVQESPVKTEIFQVGLSVSVIVGVLSIVEVSSPGPKGDPATSEAGPAFTYSTGRLVRVDYDSGAYKVISYSSGRVAQVDFVKNGSTVRKSFVYNNAGVLQEVIQSTV